MDDGPDHDQSTGRVLNFRPRGRTSAPVLPRVVLPNSLHDLDSASNDDLAKYERPEGSDDYRHRMRMNAVAIIFVTILVAAGIWIADTMAEMQKQQDCVLQGRRNCAPIDVQALQRH
jgi:hypothetical protein